MKNFCLLTLFLILNGFCYSQFTYPIDMEGTYGAGEVFGGFGGATATVVTNPDQTGWNTSPNVLRIVKGPPEPWAGMEFIYAVPVPAGSFGATGTTPYVCFDYYTNAPVGSTMSLKFELNGNCCAPLLNINTAVSGEWSQVCFTPPVGFEGRNKPVIIFRDGDPGDGGSNFTLHVDNINLYATPPVIPTPTGVPLPITFEGAQPTFVGTNGASFQSPWNIPTPVTTNLSTAGGLYTRLASSPMAELPIDISTPLDFSVDHFLCMKIWTTQLVGTNITCRIEGPSLPTQSVSLVTAVSDDWQSLCFDFSGNIGYTRIVLDFGSGAATADSFFIFDDIEQPAAAPMQNDLTLPITFEGGSVVTNDFGDIGGGFGGGNGFDGGVATVISNTQSNGINTSATVGQIVRYDTPSAGSFVNLTGNLNFAIDPTITMKVFTTALAGTRVTLKLEDPDGSQPDLFRDAFTVGSGAWETLEWDFSGVPAAFNRMTFLFDFESSPVNGSPTSIFLFDDIEQPTAPPVGISLPIDFEGDVVTADFANFDTGVGSVVSNPSATGINTSPLVGRIVRSAQNYSGSRIVLAQNLDFSTETTISMKVYTTEPAGTPFIFKLEGANPTAEDNVVTGAPGVWQSFEFDFTGTSTTLNELVFLFDANNSSPGSIFYFDDINQRAPNEVALPLVFEGGLIVENDLGGIGTGFDGANGIDGGAATVIPNPQMNGINTSATVGQIIRRQTNSAGAFVNLAENLFFDLDPIICMNVFTDAPVGTRVVMRIEDTDTGQPDIDREAFTAETGVWEPLCFVYQLIPNAYDRITFLFDLGNIGNGTSTSTFLFDDVEQIPTPLLFSPGSQFFCPDIAVTLSYPNGSGDYNWYDDPGATNLVGTGPTYTTPILTGNASFYLRDMGFVLIDTPQPVGPTTKGSSDPIVGTSSVFFTSNIDNGSWHGVDIVQKIVGGVSPHSCQYTVEGLNLTQATSQSLTINTTNTVDNFQRTFAFTPTVPLDLNDNMELRVTVSGDVGCLISGHFAGGDVITEYPTATSGGELVFTGHSSNRWMGFDYTISGEIVDPNIYQINLIEDCLNPLPIELLDFSVSEDDGHALLTWSTSTELNNEKFILLRTTDGIDFKTIGTVAGAGNSTSLLNYSFRDFQPEKGLSYYQLMQVDYDGTESLSDLQSFVNVASEEFVIFPNPTTQDLTLSFNEDYDRLEVLVYDMMGRQMDRIIFGSTDRVSFQLDGPSGIYFVEVNVNKDQKEIFKVLKQ